MHAYIACLSFDELCEIIIASFNSEKELRLALRNRLLRLLRESECDYYSKELVELVDRTLIISREISKIRIKIDALHSAIFIYLPVPTQQTVLEGWVDRGTRGGMARWLKATAAAENLFDPNLVLQYWRATGDYKAAQGNAYRASPEFLAGILSELTRKCEQGWIVSKAVMRAEKVDEETWNLIKQRLPATYAYLCAKMKRRCDADEAFSLFMECPDSPFDGSRGLAIWSIGQMGLIDVLDRINNHTSEPNSSDRQPQYSH